MELFIPSARFFNAVINHAGVRPTVQQGEHALDASGTLERPGVKAIAFNCGAALFIPYAKNEYDGHVFCLPGHRGAEALSFGKRAIKWLFVVEGGHKLCAPVPLVLPAARIYCRRLGMTAAGRDLFQEYFEAEARSWAG